MGNLETGNEKMQTPIPTPPRSFRNYLSSDKATFVELTDNHDTISVVLRTSDLPRILKKSNDALHVAVPKISISATNDHLKDTFLKIISQDLATRVPKMFEDLFKQHMESIASNVRSSSKASIASIYDLQHRLYMKMKRNIQSQIDDSVIWGELQDKFGTYLVSPSTCRPHVSRHRNQDDHLNDNPEGEKKSKKQKSTIGSSSVNVTTSSTLTSSKSKVVHKPRTYATQPPIPAYNETWSKVHDINDGVNILEEANTKFIAGIQDQLKCSKDVQQIQILQQDICSTKISSSLNEAKKYILLLHKIHATSFLEDDLEELLKRWVRKVFINFHVSSRLFVHHWNSNWARMYNWQCVSKTRSDPDELFTNRKIVDILSVRHHEVHWHEQIDEVIVQRNNDKFYSFIESDFKYLNKNNIEDMCYICLRRRNDTPEYK
ncbi:hypothetical protein Tco_0824256 [Tanacetum coccineum]|uniref:Uncharacterized protein n=1 Tax=Tanacetum coccineum TaxID=301880 RepID=A0ABQ5ANL5_9ASTR